MSIRRVVIFSNGTLDQMFIKDIKSNDFIIGIDRAAYWLIEHGIIPDIAIGDFDSTNNNEMASIRHSCKNLMTFSSKKDFTDTELAILEAIKLKPAEVVIYGATGTRIDHTLANIFLLEKLSDCSIDSSIKDLHNEIRLVKKTLILKKNNILPFVSLLPVTDLITVSLTGFVYDIDHQTIIQGQSLGVSNEISKKTARIIVHQGKVLVIRSKD